MILQNINEDKKPPKLSVTLSRKIVENIVQIIKHNKDKKRN